MGTAHCKHVLTMKGQFNMHSRRPRGATCSADLDHEAVGRKSPGRGRHRQTTRGVVVRGPHAAEREEVVLRTEEELGGMSSVLRKR